MNPFQTQTSHDRIELLVLLPSLKQLYLYCTTWGISPRGGLSLKRYSSDGKPAVATAAHKPLECVVLRQRNLN